MTENILFICGSLNQTIMMHKIARQLAGYDCFFTPFYADGPEDFAAQMGWPTFSVLGGQHLEATRSYLASNSLPMDVRGQGRKYELIVTCSDLIVPKNIRRNRIVLVQDGITEPEAWLYEAVKRFKLPRYLANTASLGFSDAYDVFCVGSEAYRQLFIGKGVRPEKIAVTGMPNLDDLVRSHANDFLLHEYVLVATSPLRETFRRDDRGAFLRKSMETAAGRPLVFKLHPTENAERAEREIHRLAPEAPVYMSGNVNHMIANASVVITQQSTCTFVAVALGKEVHTNLDISELKRLMPIQNGGVSAQKIAGLCRRLLHAPMSLLQHAHKDYRARPRRERVDFSE
jgi:hypothetical protein